MMNSKLTYRTVLAWMLLFIYFFGAARMAHPYLEYSLNYTYISEVLCVNKEKPELHCNGKCHLNKELKKAANEESGKKVTSLKLNIEIIPAEEVLLYMDRTAVASIIKYPSFPEAVHSQNPENTTPPPRG